MILVTGASGLVGLHLIQKLSEANTPLRALYHSSKPITLPNTNESIIEWMQCDVLDTAILETAFENITHVYHCAAMVSYDSRLHDKMTAINVEGTANVVNFSVEKQVQKFIHVSSIASIGKEEDGSIITEKTEWIKNKYTSAYSESKFNGEMEVFRGIAEGLNAAIVNPAIILGEGNWNKSSSNLFKIVHDEFPYYTKGATAWVDVKDVVNAMILLMNSNISNKRFIVCEGNYSFRSIFTAMAKAMNKKPPHILATVWMTEIVWRLSYLKSIITGKVATITKETARSAHQISEYSSQSFLQNFPSFTFTPINKTIERVGSSFIN